MIGYRSFCYCAILMVSFEGIICTVDDFNVDIETMDAKLIYTTVTFFLESVKHSMFVFYKNEECANVSGIGGSSPAADNSYIYLSFKDIPDDIEHEEDSRVAQFDVSGKTYRIVFENAEQAEYFATEKALLGNFSIELATETVTYSSFKLTSFVNNKVLYFKFGNYFTIGHRQLQVTARESTTATLRKTNGLREFDITFESEEGASEFLDYY